MLNPFYLPAEGFSVSPPLPAEGVPLYLMPLAKGFAESPSLPAALLDYLMLRLRGMLNTFHYLLSNERGCNTD